MLWVPCGALPGPWGSQNSPWRLRARLQASWVAHFGPRHGGRRGTEGKRWLEGGPGKPGNFVWGWSSNPPVELGTKSEEQISWLIHGFTSLSWVFLKFGAKSLWLCWCLTLRESWGFWFPICHSDIHQLSYYNDIYFYKLLNLRLHFPPLIHNEVSLTVARIQMVLDTLAFFFGAFVVLSTWLHIS